MSKFVTCLLFVAGPIFMGARYGVPLNDWVQLEATLNNAAEYLALKILEAREGKDA